MVRFVGRGGFKSDFCPTTPPQRLLSSRKHTKRLLGVHFAPVKTIWV